MQLTSTVVLAALFALKATSVLALPVGSTTITYNEARNVADFDNYYEARSYDDELEFDARELNDEFELESRDLHDYEQFEARTFSPKAGTAAAKSMSKGASKFQNKIITEKSTMQKEEAAIKKQEARLKAQQSHIKLQEQVHAGRKLLRNDNAFGTGKGARHTTTHTPTTPVCTGSRFQNKIKSEQGTMQREKAAIKKQEARLKAQQGHVKLQEQLHADRKLLRNDNAFGTANGAHRTLTHTPSVHAPGSRFQNKINSEQSTMRHEEQVIKDQEARLKAQQSQVRLHEQIHADGKLLRNSAF